MVKVAAALALALWASPAWAWLAAGPVGYGHWLQGVIAPLDGGGAFAAPAAGYSFRKLKSTYAGPAIRLRRASDNLEVDIPFLGFTGFTGAPWNGVVAATHCAATTCFASVWYDQSGGGRDQVRSAASQPTLIFNCLGSLPCLRAASSAILLGTVPSYTPVLPLTFSAVAARGAGSGACYWPQQYTANNALGSNGAGANQWALVGGVSGVVVAGAADAAWHAGVGVIDGVSSVLRIDGAEVTGTATGGTAAQALVAFWGADATTCSVGEVVQWDGYAMSAGERGALTGNQRAYWGF